jgi:hypothetical protein
VTANVAGHYHMTVLVKFTVRPWPSVKSSVVENLQQDIEYIRMCFLNFIKATAHCTDADEPLPLACHLLHSRRIPEELRSSRLTVCRSMNSLMSNRTMACSSSNMTSAKRLAEFRFSHASWT